MIRRERRVSAVRGFTLIEVLVALVIVAFGMGALLAALSAAAANVGALRDKTLAQWIALNQVTDARLNLQAPPTGTTQGDLNNFGNGNWHWQQDVTALTEIPGLMQITVSVRRNSPDTPTTKSASTTPATNWLATVVGFRGTALAAASGEVPDWTGTAFSGASSSSGSNSASSSGNVANPGTTTTPLTPATPNASGSSSSGGN